MSETNGAAKAATLLSWMKPLQPFLDEEGLTELCINRGNEIWCEVTLPLISPRS